MNEIPFSSLLCLWNWYRSYPFTKFLCKLDFWNSHLDKLSKFNLSSRTFSNWLNFSFSFFFHFCFWFLICSEGANMSEDVPSTAISKMRNAFLPSWPSPIHCHGICLNLLTANYLNIFLKLFESYLNFFIDSGNNIEHQMENLKASTHMDDLMWVILSTYDLVYIL